MRRPCDANALFTTLVVTPGGTTGDPNFFLPMRKFDPVVRISYLGSDQILFWTRLSLNVSFHRIEQSVRRNYSSGQAAQVPPIHSFFCLKKTRDSDAFQDFLKASKLLAFFAVT
jgi:hypothetical protein